MLDSILCFRFSLSVPTHLRRFQRKKYISDKIVKWIAELEELSEMLRPSPRLNIVHTYLHCPKDGVLS